MNDKLHIRTAQISDAEELLAIYKPYIENTAITFEYDVPSIEEFANRIKTTLKKYPYIVAELNGKIVGYAYAGVFKGRKAYDWSVETSIYIRLENHRNGISIPEKFDKNFSGIEFVNKNGYYLNIAYNYYKLKFLIISHLIMQFRIIFQALQNCLCRHILHILRDQFA